MSIVGISSNYNNQCTPSNRTITSLSKVNPSSNVNTSNVNIPQQIGCECSVVTATTISSSLQDRISVKCESPYSYLADKNGIISYKGVTFVCDTETKSLCLGDMSNQKNVLNISLSGGGTLKVNRDNLGDLSKAISMFSPEDINLIMRAIAQDSKIQEMQIEIDDATNSLGNSTDASASGYNPVDSGILDVTDEMINCLLQDVVKIGSQE